MSISNPDFYARYGLINVREAMKRPFAQAFPAWAGRLPPPTEPPPLPQLRSRSVTGTPLWTAYPPADGEQAAKRRRVEVAQGLPPAAPPTFTLRGGPVIGAHSQTPDKPALALDAALQSAEIAAADSGATEGMTDAELTQCARLLGWDGADDLRFLKCVVHKDDKFVSSKRDSLNAAKKLIDLLDALVAKEGGEVIDMPEVLQSKLMKHAIRRLKTVHARKDEGRKSAIADQIERLTMGLLNANWAAFRAIKKIASFDHVLPYCFAGGKVRFSFIGWCIENKIRLDDKELSCLCEMNIGNHVKNFVAVHDQLKQLVNARHGLSAHPACRDEQTS